jgi:hypothetical protein
MSEDKPPPLLRSDPGDLRNLTAAILAFAVQGLVLAHALARPDDAWRWALYAAAVAFFIWVFVVAGRKMKERARLRLEEERRPRGAGRPPKATT